MAGDLGPGRSAPDAVRAGRSGLERLLATLATFEEVASVLLLATILGLMFTQVIARYLFQAPLFWSDELGRYCYVWMSFVAATALVARRGHIRIDLINGLLGPRARSAVDHLSALIVIGTCAYFVFGSWDWLMTTLRPTTPALRMPLVWLYGVVWCAFLAMALHAVVNLALSLSGRQGPEDDPAFE
ncbi:MAG: TRAP transporter small permease [Tistlia sp.]|uniref:TRAP transporter small permease n=1 Tax=Tistlia sp. TaxID=3057121 RepID=UPI0034A30DC4